MQPPELANRIRGLLLAPLSIEMIIDVVGEVFQGAVRNCRRRGSYII